MKILLAPAETKISGGLDKQFSQNNFIFPDFFDKRELVLDRYTKFINQSNVEELKIWFGLKDEKEVRKYQESLMNKPSIKAIQRYTGVVFDALEYNSLNTNEQSFIDNNVYLFSNLFGPLRANDMIPDYRFKQGAKLPNINVEKFYKDNFTEILDDELGNEIIDIRASYYEKFYQIKKANVLTFKFIKDGKVVSHWAKYYRGKLLRTIAQNNITSFSSFMQMPIDGLKLIEIQEKNNIKLLIMQVL